MSEITGNPRLLNGVKSPQSIYETSNVKNHRIGTKAKLGDRVFYYASHIGAGLAIGTLCTRAAATADHVSVVWAAGGASNTDSVTVTLGATSVAANLYADGYVLGIDGTGSGQSRVIREHPTATASATLEVFVYDPFTISFAASAELSLIRPRHAAVITTPGDAVVDVVGVPQVTVADGSTTPKYFWIQTFGPGMVVGDGSAFADGSLVRQATSTTADAGQVTVVAATTSSSDVTPIASVGTIIEKGDGTSDVDFRFVDFTISA